jgi:hypothetical protein
LLLGFGVGAVDFGAGGLLALPPPDGLPDLLGKLAGFMLVFVIINLF